MKQKVAETPNPSLQPCLNSPHIIHVFRIARLVDLFVLGSYRARASALRRTFWPSREFSHFRQSPSQFLAFGRKSLANGFLSRPATGVAVRQSRFFIPRIGDRQEAAETKGGGETKRADDDHDMGAAMAMGGEPPRSMRPRTARRYCLSVERRPTHPTANWLSLNLLRNSARFSSY